MIGFAGVLMERMEAYKTAVPSKGKELVVLKNQLVETEFAKKGMDLTRGRNKCRPNGVDGQAYQSGKITGNGAELGRGVAPSVAGLLT